MMLCGLALGASWLVRDAFAVGRRVVLNDVLPETAPPPPALPEIAAPPPKTPRATLAFVGDVSLAGAAGLRIAAGKDPNFPFAAVERRLKKYELLVGNLECVVASQGQATIPEPLIAPPATPRLLLEAGFDLVSVANNHSLDLSAAGYFEMLGRLDEAKLPYFGVTNADVGRDPFVVREIGGARVAFVGHVDRGTEQSLRDVANARAKADIVIVFVHWGIEYALFPTRYQRTSSRALIDAGADAVIASHAHVVQPIERYKGKLIAHGLGNFVFSGMIRSGSRTGALLEVDIVGGALTATRFLRVEIDDRGAPSVVGEPSEDPPLDPPGPRPLPPM